MIHAGVHNRREVTEEGDGERVFNSLLVINKEGEVQVEYNKVGDSSKSNFCYSFLSLLFFGTRLLTLNADSQVHLFDIHLPPTPENPNPSKIGESLRILPGTEIKQPVETPVGKVGLEICYDIRLVRFLNHSVFFFFLVEVLIIFPNMSSIS